MSAATNLPRIQVRRVRWEPFITAADGATVWRGTDGINATLVTHFGAAGRRMACSIFFAN